MDCMGTVMNRINGLYTRVEKVAKELDGFIECVVNKEKRMEFYIRLILNFGYNQ